MPTIPAFSQLIEFQQIIEIDHIKKLKNPFKMKGFLYQNEKK
jgi:hypothetical protein